MEINLGYLFQKDSQNRPWMNWRRKGSWRSRRKSRGGISLPWNSFMWKDFFVSFLSFKFFDNEDFRDLFVSFWEGTRFASPLVITFLADCGVKLSKNGNSDGWLSISRLDGGVNKEQSWAIEYFIGHNSVIGGIGPIDAPNWILLGLDSARCHGRVEVVEISHLYFRPGRQK